MAAEGGGGMKVTGEAPSTSMAVPPCAPAASCSADEPPDPAEREIFIDNLLVQVHWIIKMIVEERPCAMGV